MNVLHEEISRQSIEDLDAVRNIARALRNEYFGSGEGETPTICEVGTRSKFEAGVTFGKTEWDPHLWRYELHVGCGEECPVLAVVPYDFDGGMPDLAVARAIAQAGRLILDLANEVERLRNELTIKT